VAQCISGIVNDKVIINNFRFRIIKQFPLILDKRSQSYLSWFIVSLAYTENYYHERLPDSHIAAYAVIAAYAGL